jgi:hypothetical protein
MAKAKHNAVSTFVRKPKKRRPGVHSKCKASRSKRSRNYLKAYRSQGR